MINRDSKIHYPMTSVKRHCIFLFALCLTTLVRAQSIFPVDTIYAESYNCQGTKDVCIPLPSSNLTQYTILQDGQPYLGALNGCNFDTMVTYSYNTLLGLGNMGPYHLDKWDVSGISYDGMFQNIDELVDMMNQWDPAGNWEHKPGNLTIVGGAPGKVYSNMDVTVMLNNTPSIIGVNFGLLPLGMELPLTEGMHSIVAIDNTNNSKDTLMVQVSCLSGPPATIVTDTIQANGFPYSTCMDLSQMTGAITQFYNACPDSSGEFVHFYLDSANYCVKYQGLKCGGTEEACIVICDENGFCDTTILEVTTDFSLCMRLSQKLTDTMFINFTETLCIDTLQLPGIIESVTNICPDDSGTHVAFEYDELTHCVTYTGLAPGTDNACYLLVDEFGNRDTVRVCVTVRNPQSGIILDTLLLGQSETYCVDDLELAGNEISIENSCPAIPVNEVSFSINALNLCVDAQGMSVGIDTACITVCDDYGVCDSTYLLITVVPDDISPCPNALPPTAVDDQADALLNTPRNIDILANDDAGNCDLISVRILEDGSNSGPHRGVTVLNPNMTVDYYPFLDFCGADSFEYELCTPLGCDTATVFVNVGCAPTDTIIIYNGISPNGDGYNDFFTIENIEHFPDNEVKVFNRWGNLVFQAKNYDNSWDGRFGSKKLPDGSYFYIVTLNDGREYSGFLQIQR
ncbi:MAG: hypothetical protein Kow0027_23900 [Saprospiraceae bacterium]